VATALGAVTLITFLAVAGEGTGADQARWTEARILEPLPRAGGRRPVGVPEYGNAKDWQAAQHAIRAEQRAVVAGWLKVADSPRFDSESRIAAVLMAGESRTDEAIRFCLRNLDLRLVKQAIRYDDDTEKGRPCVYALYHMGWTPLPHILEFLGEGSLTDDQARDLAEILRRVCTRETARAFLESRRGAAGEVFARSIEAVLGHL
jgi:hypothetical protein